jgi:hypothetical protein
MQAEKVANDKVGSNLRLDPPLRANERGISALFASAIGRVSSRYRAEARVDRPLLEEEIASLDEDAVEQETSAGRVDYLVWFENRVLGIELKAGSMSAEGAQPTKTLKDRWSKAIEQTRQVQNHLRRQSIENNYHFQRPASIALLVVIGRRRFSAKRHADLNKRIIEIDKNVHQLQKSFLESLQKFAPTHNPQFIASYLFPPGFREFYPHKKGVVNHSEELTVLYTPFVAFLARPFINATKNL